LGAVKLFNQNYWDAVCWNHRGLSGENNRLERLTTHGDSQDLVYVVNHCLAMQHYTQITLVGYSKGGNISLKYAGEQGANIAQEIKSVVALFLPIFKEAWMRWVLKAFMLTVLKVNFIVFYKKEQS
jgi:predicted alpha/beta-fold hydrolase